ncbi:MAG: hypothetical protein Aureis2KO_20040 [Aureisphaera sp.]
MKKRKLLYIGNNLRGKNTNVTTIETLSSHLQDIGYDVVTSSAKKNKFLRLIDMLSSVIRYGNKVSYVLIDTYSTQNFYYAVAVANLCRLFKTQYIPILHGGNLPSRLRNSKAASYKLFTGAFTNVAPSKYLQHEFEIEGYRNITFIPNTIELSAYPFKERIIIRPKLFWVRSFAEIYNPMLALKLVKHLSVKVPEIELCMVGPDKDGSLQMCKQYAKEHGLRVNFPGKLTKQEWRDLSQGYDVFINTTNFDNTPVSVIEAMALGLPVISTNVGGMPYLVENEVDGKLVPPNDVEHMAEAIVELLNNPQKALSLAQNARGKVGSFDWEKVKLDWGELLKE